MATTFNIIEIEKPRIIRKATHYLGELPRTVTADKCKRSQGGANDYYSEGDHWWPNPNNSEAPPTFSGMARQTQITLLPIANP